MLRAYLARRRRARDAAAAPPRQVTLLEFYGARTAPDFRGHWVYAFADRPGSQWSDGLVWYAGQSEHLWSRWRDHYYSYRARFDAAVKYVIPVRDQAQADLYELQLIDYYQPECNTLGRADDLRKKVKRYANPQLPSLDTRQAGARLGSRKESVT